MNKLIIISGGQTGADRAGLEAAKELGITTGGKAPKGYKTDIGSDYSLRDVFHLKEDESSDYKPRTIDNVRNSDITVILGNIYSPGCTLTKNVCIGNKKKFYHVDTPDLFDEKRWDEHIPKIALLLKNEADYLDGNVVVNIAGNRERMNPGITEKATMFCKRLFIEILNGGVASSGRSTSPR